MSAGSRASPQQPQPHPSAAHPRRATAAGALALVAAGIYAGAMSGVKPFTALAYVAVAAPSALCAAALVAQRLRPGAGPWRRMDPARPQGAGTGAPWLAVIGLIAAVELASYFHPGPRADYPTLSFGLDALFRHRALRAGGWFAWLVLGWYLARR